MTIHEQLKKELPISMKARDAVRTRTIKALLTAFTNEVISQRRKPDELLDDDGSLSVLKRSAKQRRESIEQFEKGDRPDLARHEREELSIIETYLPETMNREEIEIIAKAKKKELGITDKSKIGILIGAIMKEAKGNADGKDVKEVVDSLFS